jgi:hypothetical protein
MKLRDIAHEDKFVDISEIGDMPMMPATGATLAPGGTTDPQAAAKAQAMAVKQMQDRKQDIQDAIKAKQAEIVDLQRELAELR